jgi:sugar lactone lactonase YvrE
VDTYQFEVVEGWPKQEIKGVAASVACDSKGRAYVGIRNIPPGGGFGNILPGEGRVLVLNPDGSVHGDWDFTFSSPHAVWISDEDEVFVADTGLHTITKHAPSGEVLLTLGTPGKPGGPGQPFNMPTAAVKAANGDIVVSDGYGQNRMHRFTAQGEHILSWGSGNVAFGIPNPGEPSTGPGELNVPHDVVVDSDSRVIVADRENGRLQFFTLDGEYLSMFSVTHPNKMQIDPDGNLLVGGNAGVELWTKDGTRLGGWGEKGNAPGQFVTGSIHGIWLDAEGSIYTAEAGVNNRLQKFARV